MTVVKRNAEIVAIACQKVGRFWKYNFTYIAALYGISRSSVSSIINQAGLRRNGNADSLTFNKG